MDETATNHSISSDYITALADEIERQRAIITDAIPFIGRQAHVPEILERAEKAVRYEEALGDDR